MSKIILGKTTITKNSEAAQNTEHNKTVRLMKADKFFSNNQLN